MKKKSVTIKNKHKRLLGVQFASKYDNEYIERLADEMYLWFTGITPKINKEGETKGTQQLWLKDFAIEKGFGNQRITEFATKNKYFKFVREICGEIQESKLFKLGLTSKSSMPIFALKAVAGWRDGGENDKKNDENLQQLMGLFGQTMVQISGASRTASNDPEIQARRPTI